LVEAADKLFSELLNELSLENAASGDTFRAIFNSTPGDELLRERYLQRLRKRAVDLGMRAGEFDASRRAFERDQKVAAAKEKAKRDKEDSYINMGVAPYMVPAAA
jgi:hypothetical protein